MTHWWHYVMVYGGVVVLFLGVCGIPFLSMRRRRRR